jgi:DNA polymerase III alpha subunit
MYNVIPCFKSEYSVGKSILTLDKIQDSIDEKKAISIGTICKVNDIKVLYLVEDSLSGFLKAYKLCEELNIELRFGLRISVVQDGADKSDESYKNSSKIIIFIKNTDGYKDLLKIHNRAATEFFYYEKRTSWTDLRDKWSDNLELVYPFFDSFLHKNTLSFATCLPDDSFTIPIFFDESAGHDLPFSPLIKNSLDNFVKNDKRNCEVVKSHSIYYFSPRQFKAFSVFKTINARTTLSKPNLDSFCADTFSYERWKEIENNL